MDEGEQFQHVEGREPVHPQPRGRRGRVAHDGPRRGDALAGAPPRAAALISPLVSNTAAMVHSAATAGARPGSRTRRAGALLRFGGKGAAMGSHDL